MSATNRGSTREEQDFYATPAWCTEDLLKNFDITQFRYILEPCSGSNAITDVIINYANSNNLSNIEVITNDIRSETPAQYHYDFLTGWEFFCESHKIDAVITNPPYTHAMQFIEKGLSICDTVVMLLRLNFLGSRRRFEFFKAERLEHIYVLHKRPSFVKGGTDATEYAWFVFKNERKGDAKLRVI